MLVKSFLLKKLKFIKVHSAVSFITRFLLYLACFSTKMSLEKIFVTVIVFFIINDFFFVAAFPQDRVTLVRQSVNISDA